MSYYNYVSLYLFIFIYFFLEIESFTPVGRFGHTSVLVENKLYFFGGSNNGCSNDVIYLDLSQLFNTQAPQWNDLTSSARMPFKICFVTASSSNINNEQTIYLFGATSDGVSMINTFKLNSLTWNVPVVKGNSPERRREINSVIDNTEKTYIFGGNAGSAIGSASKDFNDMVIFNAVDLSWSISNTPVISRSAYTATLLSNGVIVYIGGYGVSDDIDISQITLYDTKSSTWSNKVAKLIDPIDSRDTHTAVLAPNGKIIIYGGAKIDYTQAIPDIAVLNTETEPFEWTAPLVSSNVGKVPSLTSHTANLVNNYMIVAFGNITQPNGYPLANTNSKIYLLDVRNYTWVDTFEPSTPPSTTSSNPSATDISSNPSTNTNIPQSNNQLTTMKVVIASMSGIFGTAILMTIGFFGIKIVK